MRNKKIEYFMAKDTRLIMDNFTKVIMDEGIIVIKYTVIRQNFDDETIIALRYYKSINTMIIYDTLKEYNSNVYEAFIEWAEEQGIEWHSIEKVGNKHERNN